jgi:hypothetical protein
MPASRFPQQSCHQILLCALCTFYPEKGAFGSENGNAATLGSVFVDMQNGFQFKIQCHLMREIA